MLAEDVEAESRRRSELSRVGRSGRSDAYAGVQQGIVAGQYKRCPPSWTTKLPLSVPFYHSIDKMASKGAPDQLP